MKWATGVTVAPRKNPTFDRCYQSFLDSGFKPHIFKEPGVSIHPAFSVNGVTERMYTLGAWKNWLLGLRELRTSKPNADIYGKLKDTVDMNTTEQVNHDFRKLIAGIKATQ